MAKKSELRKIYLEKRSAMSQSAHAELTKKIAAGLFRHFDLSPVKSIHSYISAPHLGEVDTAPIFIRVWEDFPAIKTYAPRVNVFTGEIEELSYSANSVLVENKWRIKEPTDGEIVDPSEMDLVIVPLLCFDESGNRVGYGKGFYDRFLARCRPDCVKVGLSSFPPVENIDDVHDGDVRLEYCVTPDEIFVFKAKDAKDDKN